LPAISTPPQIRVRTASEDRAHGRGCSEALQPEGTREYVDDSVIATKVKTAILGASALKVAEINVETCEGVVHPSGFVESRAAANKAVEVARGVGGVRSLKDDMRVK